jgi:hypothetical protein
MNGVQIRLTTQMTLIKYANMTSDSGRAYPLPLWMMNTV